MHINSYKVLNKMQSWKKHFMILLTTNNTQNIIYDERTPTYTFSEAYICWLPHFLTRSIIEFCQTNILLKLKANQSFLMSCVNIIISKNKFLLIINSLFELWQNKIGIINFSVCFGCMCMHVPVDAFTQERVGIPWALTWNWENAKGKK